MSQKQRHFLISFGSNLGDRFDYLVQTKGQLKTLPLTQILNESNPYLTEPIGAADQTFLNCVLLCSSCEKPEVFLNKLLAIEANLGRQRSIHWGNRTVDLDILLIKDSVTSEQLIIGSPNLQVPHPRLLERDFMLVPAADIAPDWVHPISGLTLREEVAKRGFNLKSKV